MILLIRLKESKTEKQITEPCLCLARRVHQVHFESNWAILAGIFLPNLFRASLGEHPLAGILWRASLGPTWTPSLSATFSPTFSASFFLHQKRSWTFMNAPSASDLNVAKSFWKWINSLFRDGIHWETFRYHRVPFGCQLVIVQSGWPLWRKCLDPNLSKKRFSSSQVALKQARTDGLLRPYAGGCANKFSAFSTFAKLDWVWTDLNLITNSPLSLTPAWTYERS